ncbi:MAG: DMT family transporter [Marinovum sp.]|nr:DMT family transporter [Marinovum sp.]
MTDMTAQNLRPRAAALSMLAGMAIIGAIDNAVAPMANEIGLWQFFVLRTFMALPLVALTGFLGFGALFPIRLWAVAARGALIATAMLFYFGALAFIPLPQALAGLFVSPIFVLLMTAYWLRQRVGPWRVGAVFFGFLGILLVVSPWGENWHMAAVMPVMGALLYALGVIATRTICAGEPVLAMLASLFIFQALFGLMGLVLLGDADGSFVSRGWVWPLSPNVWALIAAQAVGSTIGVGLLFRGYALGEASNMAVFEYSVFIFAAFFAWLFFGDVLSMMASIGMALVAASGIVIVLRSPTS